MFNRVSTRLSVRLFVVSLLIVAITTVSASAGWTDYINPFSYFATANESTPQSVVETPVLIIGTCDTAGPIEVEATAGTPGPTAYASLNAAFTAINAGTHQGSINVEVCGNTTETSTAALNSGSIAPASYSSIVVRPVGGSRIIEGTLSTSTVKLNGADNVTIDGRIGGLGSNRDLTIRNNSGAAGAAAVWLASVAAGNGASNNTIRNLEIAGGSDTSSSSNSTFGIIMCGTAITVSSNGTDNDNNSILANRVIKARYGITTRGTTTNLNISPIITDNIVGPASFGTDQIGKVGIFLQADTGAIVSRNTVQSVGCLEPQACTGADRMGIAIGNESWSMAPSTITSDNYTITKNTIRDIIDENTFSSVGINVATTNGGAPTNNVVANNFIYNVRSNGTTPDQAVGLGIAGGHTDRVVFNSISMTGDVDPGLAAASDQAGSGIRIANASSSSHANLTLKNNSVLMDLSSSSTPGIRFYAITGPSNAYSFGTGGENNNNYYVNPLNSQLMTGGLGTTSGSTYTTQFATLALWQAAYTVTQDANSIQANPNYVSATDLHITGAPNESAGVTVAGVTDDIDGDARGATPDIGADEITLAGPGTVQFSATSYTSAEGNNVTITVNRTGGSSGAISVDYAAGGGTATGGASCTTGVDYITPTPGTLNWADTDTAAKTFNVQLCADNDVETESLDLTLSNPVGTTISGTNPVPLNITDNPPGTIQFSSTTYAGDEGLVAVVTATRTSGTGGAVSVNYATSDGTATNGVCGSGGDYVSNSGTLNWNAGEATSKTFTVTLCTDLLTSEGAETVNLTLSSPTGGASLGTPNTAVLTINDLGITFCNGGTSIPIADAVTNQSTIAVSSLSGTINTVKVKLNNLSHTFGSDIDVLLVGPNGEKFIIMSDALGSTATSNATITLADSAAALIPTSAVSTGSYTYRPTNYTTGDTFASPAPAGPYQDAASAGTATFASVFGGANPNGNWNLYVYDDGTGDTGSFAGGWCLEFTLNPPSPGTIQFGSATYSGNENSNVSISVARTGGTSGAVTVDYQSADVSASSGTCGIAGDYVATGLQTLSWADGEGGSKTFNVSLCPDASSESPETFNITLSNATGGATIGATNPTVVTINDVPPPLTGTYNVPGDFPSLTNNDGIFKALNDSGASGNIIINIAADLTGETGTHALNAIASPYTVRISPTGGARTVSSTATATRLIALNGADRVTIDGSLTPGVGTDRSLILSLTNATASGTTVVTVSSLGATLGATNNTIKNSVIQNATNFGTISISTSFNFGIYAGLNTGAANGPDNDDLTIQNNLIQRVSIGIQANGASGALMDNLKIEDNTFGGTLAADAIGIEGAVIGLADNASVTRNTMSNFARSGAGSIAGIFVGTGTVNSNITRNRLSNFETSTSNDYGATGIYVATGAAASNVTVANNMIYDIRGEGSTTSFLIDTVVGIRVDGTNTGGINVWHNSVNLFGNYAGYSGATISAALMVNGTTITGLDIRNNILVNTFNNTTVTTDKSYSIYTTSANTMFASINYNDYLVSGSTPGVLGAINSTDRTTLTALATATGGDANSINQVPSFVSDTDLHLQLTSLAVGAGTSIGAVTVDYDNDPRPASNPDIGADEIVQAEGGSIAAGSYYNAALATGETIGGGVTVTNRLYLNGISSLGANTLTMGCGATVSGDGAASYVNGTITKNYCGAEVFRFPIGSASGFTPVEANVSAVVGASSLTASVYGVNLDGFDPTESIERNWELEETGDVTATLRFWYLDSDIAAGEELDEVDYVVWRRQASGVRTAMCTISCVDTTNNILGPTIAVTDFSRWTGSKDLAPTSSAASVSGRVVTANGQGIRGAAIVITGNSLPTPIIVKTGSLGYFQADNLDTGQTYVVTVVSKRFTFSQPSRVINLTDSINDVDFIANPLE